MVAQSASAKGFAPSEKPRVAVAADGSVAAIHDGARVVVTEVPSCAPFAELGLDDAARECELAWVGTPPRLLVLSRYAAHTIVHLVDPFGPRMIAELRLESAMQLAAAVGNHALAIGAAGAIVLTANERGLAPYQFPARTIPTTAGAAGANFVVALPGAIEEWDPQSRLPKRRLKLPRQAPLTAVGGSDRVVWLTTSEDPTRIDVIPLVNRGQPKLHELPEPIEHIASHPRSDLVACLGARSGRVWVIDLDGRIGMRMIGPEGIDRVEALGLVIGRVAGLLAAQAKRPLTVVALEHHDEVEPAAPVMPRTSARDTESARRSALDADDAAHGIEPNTSVTLGVPPADAAAETRSHPLGAPSASAAAETRSHALAEPSASSPPRTATPSYALAQAPAPSPASQPAGTVPASKPAGAVSPQSPWSQAAAKAAAERSSLAKTAGGSPLGRTAADGSAFAVFRERIAQPRARTSEAFAAAWHDVPTTWRDDIARWTHDATVDAQLAGAPALAPIDLLVARYEVSPSLAPALALLYGAHLLGSEGVAPIDVARVAGWPEALGRGELADKQVAVYGGSRIRLVPAAQRVLDELPPSTGRLIGSPGMVSLLGPCVIVAAGPLAIIAEACLASIGGAILAAHDDVDPRELVAEARAYGAAPMLRVSAGVLDRIPADQAIILVADDDQTADQLGVPRLT